MSDTEWVTIEALLKKGEYPVITDLLQLGQDCNNILFTVHKLKTRIDKAVAEHSEMKIEKRIIERRNNGERRNDVENT